MLLNKQLGKIRSYVHVKKRFRYWVVNTISHAGTYQTHLRFSCSVSSISSFKKQRKSKIGLTSKPAVSGTGGGKVCRGLMLPPSLGIRPSCHPINPVNAKKPSHRMFRYMHGVLNEVYLQNFLHRWAVNCETNLMSLLNP